MSIKFFNSGLYEETFYIMHKIDFYNDHAACEEVEYDRELLASHYVNDLGLEYRDEDDKWEQVDQIFWDNLSYWSIYFEPRMFNEKIALECGLTPFSYEGVNMLALSACGMDLSPRLDAYQTLLHNTIDRNSKFFSALNQEYFKGVVGKEVMKKMKRILKTE